MLQYYFCFLFWFFDCEACRILAPLPGIELAPLHWKAKSSPLDHQGSPWFIFLNGHYVFCWRMGYREQEKTRRPVGRIVQVGGNSDSKSGKHSWDGERRQGFTLDLITGDFWVSDGNAWEKVVPFTKLRKTRKQTDLGRYFYEFYFEYVKFDLTCSHEIGDIKEVTDWWLWNSRERWELETCLWRPQHRGGHQSWGHLGKLEMWLGPSIECRVSST